MYYLLSYDIQDDKSRAKVCKRLKEWGYHLQKSVFVGDCAGAEGAEKIFREVVGMVDEEGDRVFLVPMCRQCLSGGMVFGDCVDFERSVWIF